MELNKIYNIDCLLGYKQIENESVDIIIADPPYYMAINEEWDNQWVDILEYQNWCKKWIEQSKRVLKKSGTLFIYGQEPQLAYISTLLELDKQRWLVWYYKNKSVPSLNFWQHSHESIICYHNKESIFNKDLIRIPYTEKYIKNCSGKIRPISSTNRFGKKESSYNINELGALPRDVIEISTLAGGSALKERIIYCKKCNKIIESNKRSIHNNHDLIIHPTQKPKELTMRLIKSCKPNTNFTVLIPFVGSGSECKVVNEMNGDYIGFEKDANYFKLASEYLKLKN